MTLCGTMITGSVYRPPLLHHQRISSSRGSSSSSSPWSIQNRPRPPHPICRLSLSHTATSTFNPYKLCSGGNRGGGRGRFFGGRGGGGGGGGVDDELNPFDTSIGFNFFTFNCVVACILAGSILMEYPPFDEEETFFAAMRHFPGLFRLFIRQLKFAFLYHLDPKGMKQLHLQKCPTCRKKLADIHEMQELLKKLKRNRD